MNAASHCSALFAVLALFAGVDAWGVCPLEPAHVRVGASGPPYCTDGDIQSAIAAVGSCPVVIDITKEQQYTNQHLSVSGKNVTLQGWGDGVTCYTLSQCVPYPCGAPSATNPLLTLDGGGNGRVLDIAGSNVNVRNLLITHGEAGAGSGGGIRLTGAGNLNLVNSSVTLNDANYGGGIGIEGSGGTATLRLLANSFVLNNTAQQSGGGIALFGTSRLLVQQDQVWIGYNHALGAHGGGIAIFGPARADIGSAGYNGVGVVSSNDAPKGGGISVYDVGSGEGVLRVYAHAAATPTTIEGNTAIGFADNDSDGFGGALYLIGAASACLFAPHIVDNVAEDGAAIFESAYNGSSTVADVGVYINGGAPARLGTDCGPESVASLGGTKDCVAGDADCSTISDNATQHADATPSAGTTLYVSNLVGERFRMRGNIANRLITSGDLDLKRCLLVENSVSGPLLSGGTSSPVRIHACTIANNVIDDSFVMQYFGGGTDLDLAYDIIDQPSHNTVNWLSGYGATFDVSYVLSNSTAGLPQNNPSVVQGTPYFADAAHGDYHLAAFPQLALDFGQGANFDAYVDLDGAPAPIDLAAAPNHLPGSADLGAYERQNLFDGCGSADTLFCDGFGP